MMLLRQSVAILGVCVSLLLPVRASGVEQVLHLKSFVQVSRAEVSLGDLLVAGPVRKFPTDLVICKAPAMGEIRLLAQAEILAALNAAGATAYFLEGPRQISIERTEQHLSETELVQVVESALRTSGSKLRVAHLRLQAALPINSEAEIKLLKLKFDPALQQYRSWFSARQDNRTMFFEAIVAFEPAASPTEINFGPQQRKTAKSVLIRRGESFYMEMEGQGFTATIPVIALEQASAGQAVRVRDATSKRIYYAEFVRRGLLRQVRREN